MGHGFNPWSRKIPHAAEQLSPRTTATEPVCYNCTIEVRVPTAHSLYQEKPLQWEACALQLESSLHTLQLDKAHKQQWRLSVAINK